MLCSLSRTSLSVLFSCTHFCTLETTLVVGDPLGRNPVSGVFWRTPVTGLFRFFLFVVIVVV